MNQRCRIKICGLTRPEDVDHAVMSGADALGFVLWPGSRRAIEPDTLQALSARVPPFVTRVGLFVDQSAELIAACLPFLDMLQFHGDEPPEACRLYGRPWLKALRMKDDLDVEAAMDRYHQAQGILLDAYRPGVPGGTGEAFDWARVPVAGRGRIVLAGGLTADNVGLAIQTARPFAVDVSGGVEQSPGQKSAERLEGFIDAVRQAEMAPY
ncbi:phosphoribosylanthranilate isomerase [Larsenimonas rhizosphaerae]|uniref:phosphoribosylanthranilate isomerase n=1 Tax=Larsenimonas rhizosphaerae TaxID=2944682 RepID=UPI0020335C8A|nr:phosphoribosylanthranilate isomerase [Larsenimonas rhizosphaerae]MCM2130586.1 phosphoribosylanthranilate isomerase [Larsenimonas rhizosphaerae]